MVGTLVKGGSWMLESGSSTMISIFPYPSSRLHMELYTISDTTAIAFHSAPQNMRRHGSTIAVCVVKNFVLASYICNCKIIFHQWSSTLLTSIVKYDSVVQFIMFITKTSMPIILTGTLRILVGRGPPGPPC